MEKTVVEMSDETRYVLSLDLMRIRGVQLRKHPRWFQRIQAEPGMGSKVVSWFDHQGRLKDNPEVLVVEPYGTLTRKQLEELSGFCDKHNLDYMLFPTSQHSPTRTMHVRIWPRDLDVPDY